MATQSKLSIVEYGMIAAVGYVVYKVAKSGSLGPSAQKTALQLCSSFMGPAKCQADVAVNAGTEPPYSGAPGTTNPPASSGGGRSYPCGFVQDNGDGTWSFVRTYAPNGFDPPAYTGTKAGAEQAFNASGLTFCK